MPPFLNKRAFFIPKGLGMKNILKINKHVFYQDAAPLGLNQFKIYPPRRKKGKIIF
jgi:hypothetical protein